MPLDSKRLMLGTYTTCDMRMLQYILPVAVQFLVCLFMASLWHHWVSSNSVSSTLQGWQLPAGSELLTQAALAARSPPAVAKGALVDREFGTGWGGDGQIDDGKVRLICLLIHCQCIYLNLHFKVTVLDPPLCCQQIESFNRTIGACCGAKRVAGQQPLLLTCACTNLCT